MKLRIIEKGDNYVPQYFDTEGKFPAWRECRVDDYLVPRYYDLEEAKEVIEEFKKKHPKPKVVWEEDY
jgi:hypothetical protein